ncbi:MAG: ATP-binding cassette domain-containing protein [Bacteroidetes bacterium]|nr:ATP-binding cassette domain-containing protein [Bacteroidota bacterium]MBS1685139.1 ATP-binding cassette domain-containing protein [Bacteroidota bacterium]
MAEVIIRYNHVDIHQSSGLILSDVTFEIEKGEFVYLIGRTGTGKTSLLKTLYADVPVKTGEATICGFDMTNIRKRDIPLLRRKLGIVFQDFQLLNDRTVAQNLEFVLRATGWENKDTIGARIAEVMTEVGVPDKGGKMPYQLSGGEQQRVVIARALMNNPPVIIADEPTANLDPETAADIMNLLIRINREHDTAILMATHNYQVIERYPAKIFNCQNGTIVVEKGIVLK